MEIAQELLSGSEEDSYSAIEFSKVYETNPRRAA
jgi:hypothetical protein